MIYKTLLSTEENMFMVVLIKTELKAKELSSLIIRDLVSPD